MSKLAVKFEKYASKGVVRLVGRFEALYAGALSGGSGRGTEYAVVGQYGNPWTSWQENDAAIHPIHISAQVNKEETTQTRLGSKVYRPTEPRAVLYRIHSIICEGSQITNQPLPPPSMLITKPHLLLEDLHALCNARIARHTCANCTSSLRERGESRVKRGEDECEVWR